jgi:MFS family permease
MIKKNLIHYVNSYRNFSLAIWINVLAVFLIAFGFMMSSFFTLFLHNKGISTREIGLILACGGIGAMLGSYMSGLVILRLSPVRVAQISMLGFSLVTAAFPLVNNLTLFFFLSFMGNFCSGIFQPANNLILFSHAETSEHTRVMGLNRVAYNLGLAFATSIGGFLASIHFSLFFIFSAIMSFIGALILFCFNQLLTAKPPQSIEITAPILKQAKENFFTNYGFLLLCLLFLFYNLLFFQTNITYGLYLMQMYHMNMHDFGLLFTINFLMIVFFEVPLMTYLKKINQIFLAMWGSFFVGMGLIILPFSHSYLVAIASVILWSTGEILATSPFFVLATHFAPKNAQGFYLGLFQSTLALALILAPLLGGFFYPFHRGYFLWLGCGIISLLMIFGFLSLKRYEIKLCKSTPF